MKLKRRFYLAKANRFVKRIQFSLICFSLFYSFFFATTVTGKVFTLSECIDMGIKSNLTIKKNRENVTIAQAQNLSSYSEILPYVSARSSVTRNSSVLGTNPYTDTYSENFSFSQTVFDLSSIYDIKASKLQTKGSVASFNAIRNQIEFAIASTFFDFLRKKKILVVKELGFKESDENLKKTKVMLDIGIISKVDLLRSEVVKNQAELDVIKAKKDMEISRANLAYLIGIEPDMEFDVKEESLSIRDYNIEEYKELFRKTKENNPDIESNKFSVSKSKAQLSSSFCRYLPTLSIQGSYGYSGDKFTFSKEDWQENDSWSVGASVTLPLFAGFSRMGNVKQSRAIVRMSELELDDVVMQKGIELRKSLLAIDEAKKSLVLSQKNLEQADLSYRMMQEKYTLGAATILELMDTEQDYEQAQVTQISAYFDLLLASFYVTNLLGERIK